MNDYIVRALDKQAKISIVQNQDMIEVKLIGKGYKIKQTVPAYSIISALYDVTMNYIDFLKQPKNLA